MSAVRSSQQPGSSSAGGPSSSRPPTSPPPSIASPSIAHAHAHAQMPGPSSSSSSAQRSPPPPHLQPTLPSAETQRHVTEARRAVVATLENMMDSELQWRASTLHSNAGALGKQAKDVRRAADGLRRENDRLAREADVAARRLKELGNVQNWAEVLERDFLVLEETVRLANGEGSSSSCSCSDCGSVSGSEDEMDVDDGPKKGVEDHGKTRMEGVDMVIDARHGMQGTFSDASRSLTDPESSVGRGAKGSDTASMSTASR